MVVWCTQNLRRDGCSFMWHQPCQRCKYTTSVDIQKTRYKSSHSCRTTCERSESAQESGEHRYIRDHQSVSSSSSENNNEEYLENLTRTGPPQRKMCKYFHLPASFACSINLHEKRRKKKRKKGGGGEASKLSFSGSSQSHWFSLCT